jgi:4-aminobutyrate aminotransferase-like enzyme/Ser/Thr protein kinase RdoA (MazF antagonist)
MTGALDPFLTPIPAAEAGRVGEILAAQYGLAGSLVPLPGERDQNFLLDSTDGAFVVKVANPGEDGAAIDMEQAALEHLEQTGCNIPTPRVVRTIRGERSVPIDAGGAETTLRVRSFLTGEPIKDGSSPRRVGVLAADLQHGLAGFFHPAAGRPLLWDVRSLPLLGDLVELVPESELRSLVGGVLARVEEEVLPRLASFPAQVIHNDLNPANLLVDGSGDITGVIDFGDMLHAPRIADLGVAGSYQVYDDDDPTAPLAELVTGYLERIELRPEELEVLVDLVAGRLCQSVVIAHWRAQLHPDNAGYILSDAAAAARSLATIESSDRAALRAHLLRVAGVQGGPGAGLARRRDRSLGPGLGLSYRRPLRLHRGEGVWLFDDHGERYLDAYNNVVQLGHAHPAVVGAVRRQAARLNTNTRYLTDRPVDFAERLVGLLPEGLDVCYFTNSGSEANELALRIARAVTGRRGVIVSEHAYHGMTGLTAAISPEESRDPLEDWVATVPPPGESDPGDGIERAVAALEDGGHGPAALIYDTVFSSDGIFDPGGDFLNGSMAAVRSSGGLFIADEVQAGLGRVGQRMWGFAGSGSAPDIVTLGKPLGNGYPIGAVVTSRDIAAAFAAREHFFSTFGGSTVAAAAGAAVIEATLALRLPQRADRVGGYLSRRLTELAGRASQLREVRGAGLFVGVEVADGPLAEELVERMRDRHVLIGRTGPSGNVLKIRPPLVFEEAHADIVVAALEAALRGSPLPTRR